MKNIRYVIGIIFISSFISCTSNQVSRDASNYTIPVNNFSQTVEMLISNDDFLEEEILKINAHNPSVQKNSNGSRCSFSEKEKYIEANSELERALRITKNDGALYLRLAHIRYKQGLLQESESFASKGLLLRDISSWERLLLNVYLRN